MAEENYKCPYTPSKYAKYICGAEPDLMAFNKVADNKKISYHGIDVATKWKDIHDFIIRKANSTTVNFERRDIYEMLDEPSPQINYSVIVLQYMIAGHIYSDRAEKIEILFDEIADKLIPKKPIYSPLLLIINDIDHKSWICDYLNVFIKKLRKEYYCFLCTVIITRIR